MCVSVDMNDVALRFDNMFMSVKIHILYHVFGIFSDTETATFLSSSSYTVVTEDYNGMVLYLYVFFSIFCIVCTNAFN